MMSDRSSAEKSSGLSPDARKQGLRFNQGLFFMTLLMALFGVILVSHIQSVRADQSSGDLAMRYQNRQAELAQAEQNHRKLLAENEKLNQQKAAAIASLLNQRGYEDLRADLERIRILAGFTEVRGPGIILTLDDKPGFDILNDSLSSIVHDGDIRHAFDLLIQAGAAALAVNGLRITNASAVTCIGSTILCNQERMTPPYVIRAIGDPAALAAAIRGDQALADRQIPEIGLQVKLAESAEVVVLPFAEADRFRKYIDLLEVSSP